MLGGLTNLIPGQVGDILGRASAGASAAVAGQNAFTAAENYDHQRAFASVMLDIRKQGLDPWGEEAARKILDSGVIKTPGDYYKFYEMYGDTSTKKLTALLKEGEVRAQEDAAKLAPGKEQLQKEQMAQEKAQTNLLVPSQRAISKVQSLVSNPDGTPLVLDNDMATRFQSILRDEQKKGEPGGSYSMALQDPNLTPEKRDEILAYINDPYDNALARFAQENDFIYKKGSAATYTAKPQGVTPQGTVGQEGIGNPQPSIPAQNTQGKLYKEGSDYIAYLKSQVDSGKMTQQRAASLYDAYLSQHKR